MIFDSNGKYKPLGSTINPFIFSPHNESALPNWLLSEGGGAVTFNTPGASERGSMSVATGATSGNSAGFLTKDLATSQYGDVCVVFENIRLDSGATPTNCTLQLFGGDRSTNGFIFQSKSGDSGKSELALPPSAAADAPWQWNDITAVAESGVTNASKAKNICVILRQSLGEIYLLCGDPENGGTVVGYKRGLVGFTGAIGLRIITRSAAARTMYVSKVVQRLSLI